MVPPAYSPHSPSSSKLGEENVRIRAARASGLDEKMEGSVDETMPDDDEGSIVTELKKNQSCGACRTRESEVWWKAPKGLPTGVLCDNCGLSWRKYADLNVRPMREEVGPAAKAKAENKREGTPLNGPSAKRAKVGCLSVCVVSRARERWGVEAHEVLIADDFVAVDATAACCPAAAVRRVPAQRARGQGPAVQAVPVPRPRRRVRDRARPDDGRELGLRPLQQRKVARGVSCKLCFLLSVRFVRTVLIYLMRDWRPSSRRLLRLVCRFLTVFCARGCGATRRRS